VVAQNCLDKTDAFIVAFTNPYAPRIPPVLAEAIALFVVVDLQWRPVSKAEQAGKRF
jgi:hypothetical protein